MQVQKNGSDGNIMKLPVEAKAGNQAFLSVKQCCKSIGVSHVKLYDMMRQGQLKSIRLGGRRLIPATELSRLADSAT